MSTFTASAASRMSANLSSLTAAGRPSTAHGSHAAGGAHLESYVAHELLIQYRCHCGSLLYVWLVPILCSPHSRNMDIRANMVSHVCYNFGTGHIECSQEAESFDTEQSPGYHSSHAVSVICPRLANSSIKQTSSDNVQNRNLALSDAP